MYTRNLGFVVNETLDLDSHQIKQQQPTNSLKVFHKPKQKDKNKLQQYNH